MPSNNLHNEQNDFFSSNTYEFLNEMHTLALLSYKDGKVAGLYL